MLRIYAWKFYKFNNDYYIQYTHWVYLSEICQLFKKIEIIAPIEYVQSKHKLDGLIMVNFENISFVEIANINSFQSGYKNILKLFLLCIKLDKVDKLYLRYPFPLTWLVRLFHRNKIIYHFVGNPLDVLNKSKRIKDKLNLLLYIPDLFFTVLSTIRTRVFANGNQLALLLNKLHVKANPIISSTLKEHEIDEVYQKKTFKKSINLLYVGYLRETKNVDVLIESVKIIENQLKEFNIIFNIVGTGILSRELHNSSRETLNSKFIFHGHIDDRSKLLSIYKENDIYLFASSSEGSPRSVLEAMAKSCIVVSSKVGSLPFTFKDRKDIVFVEEICPNYFAEKVEQIIRGEIDFNSIGQNANRKVKKMTIKAFIKNLFNDS